MTFIVQQTKYRTTDGEADYVFDFAYLDGGWRTYIIWQPDYQGRPQNMVTVHRLRDARGLYICWDRAVPTLDAAKGVASLWADCTQHYIRTGHWNEPPGRSQSQIYDRSSTAAWEGARVPGDPGPAPSPRPAAQTASPTRVGGLRRVLGSHR